MWCPLPLFIQEGLWKYSPKPGMQTGCLYFIPNKPPKIKNSSVRTKQWSFHLQRIHFWHLWWAGSPVAK